MKPARTIAKMPFGSHLYGTSTPISDHDFKAIHLPSGKEILLSRYRGAYEINPGNNKEKNTVNDIDLTSTSLSKFLSMVAGGDTMGVELLFVPPEMIIESSPEFERLVTIRDQLVNRNCVGFISYCQRQAAKYGIKASRFLVLQEAVSFFEAAISKHGAEAKLYDVIDSAREFANTHEHCEIVFLPHPSGTSHEFIQICERKLPVGNSLALCNEIIAGAFRHYGKRAKSAAENTGIDWKGVSHALRVGYQAYELLTTCNLTFPRPEAEYLIAVKLGRMSYASVNQKLEKLLADIESARATSTLQEKTDPLLIESLILDMHLSQVV